MFFLMQKFLCWGRTTRGRGICPQQGATLHQLAVIWQFWRSSLSYLKQVKKKKETNKQKIQLRSKSPSAIQGFIRVAFIILLSNFYRENRETEDKFSYKVSVRKKQLISSYEQSFFFLSTENWEVCNSLYFWVWYSKVSACITQLKCFPPPLLYYFCPYFVLNKLFLGHLTSWFY